MYISSTSQISDPKDGNKQKRALVVKLLYQGCVDYRRSLSSILN